MRRYSSILFDVVAGEGGRAVRLDCGRDIPAGLYSLSMRLGGAGELSGPVELRYRPVAEGGDGEARLQLGLTSGGGRAQARFILAEAGRDFSLHAPGGGLEAVAGKVRLRRLSSLAGHAGAMAKMVLRRLAKPAQLAGLAADAVSGWRSAGTQGLIRAVKRAVYVDDAEARFARLYADWAEREDRRLAARSPDPDPSGRPSGPLFSLVLMLPPEAVSVPVIDSLGAQDWPHWELVVVADDRGRAMPQTLHGNPRVRVLEAGSGLSFAQKANLALSTATGEWLGFVEAGDRLAPDALAVFTAGASAHPRASVLYCDEDRLDAAGRRCDPVFKPDWNIDLFLSRDLIGDLAFYRVGPSRGAGGFAGDREGAERHDLGLRLAAGAAPGAIVHLPRVLLHRPRHDHEVGASGRALSGERAITAYLAATGIAAQVQASGDGWRVDYALPAPAPAVSMVIATRDRLPLLKTCVESILEKTDYPDFEIIVIDNDSVEPATLEWLAAMEANGHIRCLRDARPFNYSALNNLGVEAARGDVLVLLNNDIEVTDAGWLRELVGVCIQPGVGAVGAMLHYPDGAIQHAGIVLNPESAAAHWYGNYPAGHAGPQGRLKFRQRVSAVTGACLATPRRLYRELGGLDADNLAVAYNDIDYCLKVGQAGFRVVFTPHAELVHHESASRGRDLMPEKNARLYAELAFMKKKWRETLEKDLWAMPGLPRELGQKGWME